MSQSGPSSAPFTRERKIVPAFHHLPQPTRLLLFRHGEVDAAYRGRLYGQLDVALSPGGKLQSEQALQKISGEKISAVYSSDLQRSLHLARLIAEQHGLGLSARTEFRERHFGAWQDRSWKDIEERDPALCREYHQDFLTAKIPGGENFREVRARVLTALETILQRHAGETIVLVAHAGPNRVIVANALGLGLEYIFNIWNDYCGLSEIEYFPQGSALLKKMNA